MDSSGVLDRIVAQNLGVYRAAQSRLLEDVSQEAQVTSDYRGRLVYELLQNADDAMSENRGDDRVAFLVTEEELWIANSGRALTDDDVQGLCGLGASSKVDAHGAKRASIGHKGMGFKSVLEVTDNPMVYSRTCSFQLGASHALPYVSAVWEELGLPVPHSVPAMRFPSRLDDTESVWTRYLADGFNTAFRFPFPPTLSQPQRHAIGDQLLGLPVTTVLFLRQLEDVEITIDQRDRKLTRSWRIQRERKDGGGWSRSSGMTDSGLFRVTVTADREDVTSFLVAHDANVEIGEHRDGLTGPAWEGVTLSEVSVAALAPENETEVPDGWRHFHVFLPTEERCSYPLLVNGAFTTDLSRQHVKVDAEPDDYNSYLIRAAARLMRDELLPALVLSGVEELLSRLDRSASEEGAEGTADELFHRTLVEQLANVPLLPTEDGQRISLRESVLPNAILGEEGEDFRKVLSHDAQWIDRQFPAASFCAGRWARIAADHGAMELTSTESLQALATIRDATRAALVEHESSGFELDPLLELVTALWDRSGALERSSLEQAARTVPLFPVHRNDDGTVERVTLEEQTAFYPPRAARSDLPLRGLQFMSHAVCWGALTLQERTELLGERMSTWSALFGIKEFRFEEVMRAAVVPALVLDPDLGALELRRSLRSLDALAATCQLAGSVPSQNAPSAISASRMTGRSSGSAGCRFHAE